MKENIKLILDIADKTYYNWKNEGRPVITLLNKYFSDEDLSEFLNTGQITKFENINACSDLLTNFKESYFTYIRTKMRFINSMHEHLLQYYFQYLYYLKQNIDRFNIHNKPFNAAAISFGLQYKNKFNKSEIDNFHILIDLIDFLDSEPGMWFYFSHVLKNDLEAFVEDVDLTPYMTNGKIEDPFNEVKSQEELTDENVEALLNKISPISVEGLDHYYMFHCYNNIKPYSIEDISE